MFLDEVELALHSSARRRLVFFLKEIAEKNNTVVLDRDIKKDVPKFLKNERINFANEPAYLPIKSLEKYLLEKLVNKIDLNLFRELNDYLFQGKSLDIIIKEYNTKIKNGVYTDVEKIKNGKQLYDKLKHELRQIRKNDYDLTSIVVEYLFTSNNEEIEELTKFFIEKLK